MLRSSVSRVDVKTSDFNKDQTVAHTIETSQTDDEITISTHSDLSSIESSESINPTLASSPRNGSIAFSPSKSPRHTYDCHNYGKSHGTLTYREFQFTLGCEVHTSSSFKTVLNRSVSKKRVQFSNTVHVVLIPSRKEFDSIKDDLWLSRDEIEMIKFDAYTEMKEFVERNSSTVKEAMLHLYQPMMSC